MTRIVHRAGLHTAFTNLTINARTIIIQDKAFDFALSKAAEDKQRAGHRSNGKEISHVRIPWQIIIETHFEMGPLDAPAGM